VIRERDFIITSRYISTYSIEDFLHLHLYSQMADPFSIFSGTVGVLDVFFRSGQYLNSLRNAITTLDADLASLRDEIDSIQVTIESLKDFYTAHESFPSQSTPDVRRHVEKLWENVRNNLKDIDELVPKMENLLRKFTHGKEDKFENDTIDESKLAKKERFQMLQGIKKTIKMQIKEGEFNKFRQDLKSRHEYLQTTLIALTLSVHV
jgi:chromosome segregation ATPase